MLNGPFLKSNEMPENIGAKNFLRRLVVKNRIQSSIKKEHVMKQFTQLRTVWLLSAVILLAACSGIPLKERQTELRDRYHQYAGDPVDSITHLGSFDSWTPIGKHELVVWANINDAYLITVEPPCENILFTDHIGLTQTANRVSQRFDFVKVDHWNCRIKSIQPVDYLQMKKDMRRENAEPKAAAQEK